MNDRLDQIISDLEAHQAYAFEVTRKRDLYRATLRALVEATDVYDRAVADAEWSSGGADNIDRAKDRYEAALKAARGVL